MTMTDFEMVEKLERVDADNRGSQKLLCEVIEHLRFRAQRASADLISADITKCPGCNGPADNGHYKGDKDEPASALICSKCWERAGVK